jgi:FAD/FMN-containing dehydrogenase
MDQETIHVVEASIYAAGYPTDAAAILLIDLDGKADALEADVNAVRDICIAANAQHVHVARNTAERTALWQGRKKAFGALGRLAPHLVVQDAVIPRTALPAILAHIRDIGDAHGVTVCNVFHAGDGNLHPNISYDADDPEQAARVHSAMSQIMQACIDMGGSITGEHGVGLDKLAYMDHLFTPATLSAMCDLRHVFDPERRANPGKVVPVHTCREWSGSPSSRRAETRHAAQSESTSVHREQATNTRTALYTHEDPRDQHVAHAVRNAIATQTPLIIRGRGTWRDRPHTITATHALDLSADTGIVDYVPGDLTITVRAGTSLAEIDQTLATHNQWLPLDPAGSREGSIGATVATCSYGPLATLFGTPRDVTLGLTIVTGTGDIIHTGGKVVKNVAGFDLTRLMIGAWGTLGIITQITLRVMARGQSVYAFEHMRRMLPHEYGYREPVAIHPWFARQLEQQFDPHDVLNPGLFESST